MINYVRPQQSVLNHESIIEWSTISTDHFYIHYPVEYETIAKKTAEECESIYRPVCQSLNYFPERTHVVLNTRVDFPNGTASYLPWKMELNIFEPQGNTVGSGDSWLRILIVHEFTHIVQLRKRAGISSLTYPFLGQYNVFWQKNIPRWFIEGIATLNETRFTQGGRGRTPFHWMKMAAPLDGGKPWPLENTNFTSRKRTPSSGMRYISGYFMSTYLDREAGGSFWSQVLDRYARRPLFGFSGIVRFESGKSTKYWYEELLREMEEPDQWEEVEVVPVHLWYSTDRFSDQYSPRWISEDELMFYRKSYDELQELSIINRNGELVPELQRALAKRDNGFSVSDEVLVYAVLNPHPRFLATRISDLEIVDRMSGKRRELTHQARIFSPDLSPDSRDIVAVQTHTNATRLVLVSPGSGKIKILCQIPQAVLMNPRWSPDGSKVVFALRDSVGQQNIAWVDTASGEWRYLYLEDRYHDNNPCWTRDGKWILYVSDRSGIFNIWAVNVSTGRRRQVTHVSLGAFTPDVSAGGQELAFSMFTPEGFRVVTIPLDTVLWREESPVNVSSRTPFSFPLGQQPEPDTDPQFSITQPVAYSPWNQLKPQAWFPLPYRDRDGYGLGVYMTSQDALHRHTWQGSLGLISKSGDRPYDFVYTYGGWWPRMQIRSYSLPVEVIAGGINGWWNKDALEIGITLPLVLEQNIYTSYVQPGIRLLHQDITHVVGSIFPRFRTYRGLQFTFNSGRYARTLRDVVSHKGYFLSSHVDWSSPSLGSKYQGKQISARMTLYHPTFIPHHQLVLAAWYQYRQGNYDYPYFGALPIGYGDDGLDHQIRFRGAYVFPLAYLEFSIPWVPIYIDYITASAFTDWGTSSSYGVFSSQGLEGNCRYSTGLDVTAIAYLFQRVRIRLGCTYYYHNIQNNWILNPIIEYNF